MKIIKYPNNEILSNLGNPPIFDTNDYRFMKYCINVNVDEGILIYNYLTRALVLLTEEDINNLGDIKKYDFMYKWYFLVSPDFNEPLVVDTLRERFRIPQDDLYLDHPSTFTILSTTKCNARCFYCYENGLNNKRHMTLEVAEQVADYINRVSYNHINLAWFGGEPLYNPDVMDIIASRVRSAGKTIRSSMISNGYLLTEDMVKRCRYDWGIDNIQITLDGTEEVYNKIKAYIYKEDINPFKTVINNIHNALKENIAISIRLNCGLKNIDDLFKLVEYLNTEFENKELLTVYSHHLFEINNYKLNDKDRDTLFNKLIELDNLIAKYNLQSPDHVLGGGIKHIHCMVDSGEAVTINPDGSLGLCEHYIDEKSVGHIDNPAVKNYDVIKQWRNKVPYIDICNDCPLKPSCLKVYGCPDDVRCSISQRDYQINKFKLGLEKQYDKWLHNLNRCNNCNN